MNKILLAMFVCVFSLSAMACEEHGDKDDEEDKRFTTISRLN